MTRIDVDALAQEIRRVDGNHSLGAGALAEALMPFLCTAPAPSIDAVSGLPEIVRRLIAHENTFGVETHPDSLQGAVRMAMSALEAQSRELAEARALISDCQRYLKEGETPRERMDRDFADNQSLLEMLATEKKAREASDAALLEAKWGRGWAQECVDTATKEAVAAQEALATARSRIAALEDAVRVKDEALASFAGQADFYRGRDGADLVYITLHDLRRARAALSNGEPHDR